MCNEWKSYKLHKKTFPNVFHAIFFFKFWKKCSYEYLRRTFYSYQAMSKKPQRMQFHQQFKKNLKQNMIFSSLWKKRFFTKKCNQKNNCKFFIFLIQHVLKLLCLIVSTNRDSGKNYLWQFMTLLCVVGKLPNLSLKMWIGYHQMCFWLGYFIVYCVKWVFYIIP